ncbi:MAG: dihydroorotase [Snowella sp.]|nr:dihydroorotase [Snowella sp.]
MSTQSQLLQQIRVINPINQTDQRADVWIVEGKISRIEPHITPIPENTQVIPAQELIFAPGLVDLYSYSGEPGQEERETLDSLAAAAIAGGFTHVGILPKLQPVLDNPATLTHLQQKLTRLNAQKLPKFHFWGSLTLDTKGEQLSELGELAQTEIIGFTDAQPLSNYGLLRRALEYLQPFHKPVALVPVNLSLRGNGVMREGDASICFGLPGDPVMSESLAIASILELVSATQTPVHLMRISTERGVELIADAKSRHLPITASVTWSHLLLNTESIRSYDPNLHLDPPLGNESDRLALIYGVKSGIIDAIAVDHRAYTYEEKTLSFAESPAGTIGLELALPCLWQNLVETGQLTAVELWQALSINPLRCLGLPNSLSDYLIFDPILPWIVEASTLKTLGRNTFWLNQSLQGKVTQMISSV